MGIESMAGADAPDDVAKIASHTLSYLRVLDKKLDLVLQTQARHTEGLGRVERGIDEGRRDLAETRRDLAETKGDIVFVEHRILSAQMDVLTILQRLEQAGIASPEDAHSAAPTPADSNWK